MQPGRGRRHHHQVGGLAEPGVRDGVGVVPQRGVHRLGGQGRERGRARRSARAPVGQDRRDVGAGVDQAAADLDGLVGGDAARRRRGRSRRPASTLMARSADLLGRLVVARHGRRSSSPAPRASSTADDLVGGDLLEADRQRLAGHRGHLRRHDGAQALAQLAEVGVDLAGPAGRQGHQGELGVDPAEELLDRQGSSSCRGCEPSSSGSASRTSLPAGTRHRRITSGLGAGPVPSGRARRAQPR